MNRTQRDAIRAQPGYAVLKPGSRVVSSGDNRDARKMHPARGYPVAQPDFAWPPKEGTEGTVTGTARAGKLLSYVTVLWDGEEKPRKMRPWAIRPQHALEILAEEFDDEADG